MPNGKTDTKQPRFETGEQRLLRRPQTTLGGRVAAPNEKFRIAGVQPVNPRQGRSTFEYTLVSSDQPGDLGDEPDPNNVLKLREGKVSQQTRLVSDSAG